MKFLNDFHSAGMTSVLSIQNPIVERNSTLTKSIYTDFQNKVSTLNQLVSPDGDTTLSFNQTTTGKTDLILSNGNTETVRIDAETGYIYVNGIRIGNSNLYPTITRVNTVINSTDPSDSILLTEKAIVNSNNDLKTYISQNYTSIGTTSALNTRVTANENNINHIRDTCVSMQNNIVNLQKYDTNVYTKVETNEQISAAINKIVPTDLSNYPTKTEVDQMIDDKAPDLTNYVQNDALQSYTTKTEASETYATKTALTEVDNKVNNLTSSITSLLSTKVFKSSFSQSNDISVNSTTSYNNITSPVISVTGKPNTEYSLYVMTEVVLCDEDGSEDMTQYLRFFISLNSLTSIPDYTTSKTSWELDLTKGNRLVNETSAQPYLGIQRRARLPLTYIQDVTTDVNGNATITLFLSTILLDTTKTFDSIKCYGVDNDINVWLVPK